MTAVDLSRARWRKSSRSNGGGNGNCVEIAKLHRLTAVRDSKNPDGPVLVLPTAAWSGFLGCL